MNVPLRKILGTYLVAIGILQLIIYVLATISDQLMVLFYFDPRIGLFFLETVLRRVENFPGVLSWISAAAILAVGFLQLRYDWLLPVYFLVEFLLAAPTLIMILVVAAANLSPSHGLSVGELFIPIIVFVLVTVLPVGIAIREYLATRNGDMLGFTPK